MRWDNLTVESDREARLPGYRDPAVVRTFDAPEALDVRFYEVRARSALNRVPKQSRMPFRWTINPYRGCTHACTYCLHGDTPILMGDGRTKPLRDVRPGDHVYGTLRQGAYRRYAVTEVLDHWGTVKAAYRITLADGTELIASGDHRFLSERGWKSVTGADQGQLRRPHLTTKNSLMGTGAFAGSPVLSAEYRRGYLCGLIRGDGHIGTCSYARTGRRRDDHHRFRLALTDLEALRRARKWLADLQIETQELIFAEAAPGVRAATAIRTSARDRVAAIRDDVIAWPIWPAQDWSRGFLAGIFDAEGSYRRGILRIPNTDGAIVDRITSSLQRLGHTFRVEDRGLANGMRVVRLLGGLPAQLRFFHETDPAITRKRGLDGRAIKTSAALGVESIEPLDDERPLYDISTGTGDFIANGVVSHNCFARPTHAYLDFNAGRDFEREIVVKVNVPEVLRKEVARPSWKREHVALGTNTDPYQWVESRYKLMPGIWEALRDSGTECSVLTKSPLLLRDVELFKQLVERVPFTANLSVPTLDEKAWRATEPHTPNPRARLEAAAELTRAGIPVGILIAPLMPGINDDPAQVERILEMATEAGVSSIGGVCLHLRGEVRDVFMDWLRGSRPDLVPCYEELYRRGAYAPRAERERIAELARPNGPLRGAPRRSRRGFDEAPVEAGAARRDPAGPLGDQRGDERRGAEPVQEALF